MSRLSKVIGTSILALMIISLSTSHTSAATYNHYLVVERGAYANYQCVFSNSTEVYLLPNTSLGFMIYDINMSYGSSMTYGNDTHYMEGSYLGVYLNDTIWDAGESGTAPAPINFLVVPAADDWWNFIKTWIENQSVENAVTIGPTEVQTKMVLIAGMDIYTLQMTHDRDTGLATWFSVLQVGVSTYYSEYKLAETNIPNAPGGPAQPVSPLLVGAAAIGGAAISLVAGYLIGTRTGRRSK